MSAFGRLDADMVGLMEASLWNDPSFSYDYIFVHQALFNSVLSEKCRSEEGRAAGKCLDGRMEVRRDGSCKLEILSCHRVDGGEAAVR